MVKVLCTSTQEYDKVKELFKGKGIEVDINTPENSFAYTCWSIKDLGEYFPDGTPDDHLVRALGVISKRIEDNMVKAGYDAMDVFCDDMFEAVDSEFGTNYGEQYYNK